jgi:hypothetical protein
MTVLSDTAYHSFIGEVEALNTTTIRRLTRSRRHQLPAIAPVTSQPTGAEDLVTPIVSPNAHARNPQFCSIANRVTVRDQDSAIGKEVCSGCAEATRERGRFFVADFDCATASSPRSGVRDFDAERDLRLLSGDGAATTSPATSADFNAAPDRLRAGFASELRSTSTGVGVAGGDISGVACALGLRPSPRLLASWERRSE